MTQDTRLRERLTHAAEDIRLDAERSLERFHDARPQRTKIKRGATAVAALAIAATAILIGRAALPSGSEGGVPGASGPVATSGPGGDISYTVFSQNGEAASIAVADAATGTTRSIPFDGIAAVPELSPDGSKIAYGAGATYQETDLIVANAGGSDPRDLGVVIHNPLSWSPDGSQIAYIGIDDASGQESISVIGADGSDDHVVLPGAQWQSVSWSPDATRLLVVGHPASPDNMAGPKDWDIYTVAPDGSDLVQLTHSDEWEHLADWSPDGSQIVYSRSTNSSDDADYPSDIWVMNADGTDAHQVTGWHGFDGYPIWSPDGRWIVFSSDRDATPEEQAAFRDHAQYAGVGLYVMHPDGTDAHIVVAPGSGGVLTASSWRQT